MHKFIPDGYNAVFLKTARLDTTLTEPQTFQLPVRYLQTPQTSPYNKSFINRKITLDGTEIEGNNNAVSNNLYYH